MRKTTLFWLAVLLCAALAACGRADKAGADTPLSGQLEESTAPEADTSDTVQYITNTSAQYIETEKQHVVLFGLQTAVGNYAGASGVAAITIKDDTGAVRYDRKINFSEKDFSEGTDGQWEGAGYLCGLYIAQDEIADGIASSGELRLEVSLDSGAVFTANVEIADLPSTQLKISTPQLPATFQDKAYSFTSTVTVTQLTYSCKSGYDGTASVEFAVILKLDAKTKQEESDYIHVGYKLYDSEGIVVGAGQILAGPVGVGESIKDTFTVWDLDPQETYTLKFLDIT